MVVEGAYAVRGRHYLPAALQVKVQEPFSTGLMPGLWSGWGCESEVWVGHCQMETVAVAAGHRNTGNIDAAERTRRQIVCRLKQHVACHIAVGEADDMCCVITAKDLEIRGYRKTGHGLGRRDVNAMARDVLRCYISTR